MSRFIFEMLGFHKIGFARKINIRRLFFGIREQDFYLYDYSVKKGFEDRTMFNSPHFHFLNRYTVNGNVWDSDYVNWLKTNKKSEEEIRNRVKSFIRLFEDVRINGVLKPITVFSDSINYNISPEDTRPLKDKNDGRFPLYQTKCKDFEILWGHHRAACAAFLGYHRLRCFSYPSVVDLLRQKLDALNSTCSRISLR